MLGSVDEGARALIDTHCHLDMPAFDPDREEVWQRARALGVRAAIIPGVEPARWDRTLALARPHERFVALGLHPQALPTLDAQSVSRGLSELPRLAREAGAVAIGECGLDGTVDLGRAPIARQREILAAQLEIARALELPLIVHVLRAHGEALALLRASPLPRRPGVIHSYSGGPELVREYLALGFHLSFAGAVTRPQARRPVAAARAVPLDRLLLETDAPDQPPTGAPGRRCEPGHLPLTVARLAALRGETEAALVAGTSANACRLFQLDLAAGDAGA
jgi:TatD DNase family protein